MPSDTANVKLGVCKVTFNAVDLGYTKGGVEVAVETTVKDVTVDQFGETPIDSKISGRTCKVTVPLAETTLDNLVAIMPGATLITDGDKKKVTVPHGVGTSLLALAKKLVLHPQGVEESDKSEDFVIPKAATAGNVTFAYNFENERVFNVEFIGFPDSSTQNLFIFGDETASAD